MIQSENILVTGASGFLGKTLVSHVKNQFPEYGVILAGGRQLNSEKSLSYQYLNLEKPENWKELGEKFDVIFHLASVLPSKIRVDDCNSYRSNERMAYSLIENCIRWKPKIIVNASTISVYPVVTNQILKESIFSNPDSYYGKSKLAVEKILSRARYQNTKVINLRISSIYGEGKSVWKNEGVLFNFLSKALSGNDITVYGKGERVQDFVNVHDVADGFIAAAKSGRDGIYNIGSGISISMKSLAKTIIKILKKPTNTIKYKKDIMEDPSIYLDISRARRDLGYCPKVDLESGIKEMIDFILGGKNID